MIDPPEGEPSGFSGDIAIELDPDGAIRTVRFGRELCDGSPAAARDWEGSLWLDTVSSDSRTKAERLLSEASRMGVTGFRQIQQSLPGGDSVPVEYAAVRDASGTGTVLLGRDLRGVAELQRRYVEAQQSLERDHWKLRQVETRYRMIFRESSEPGVVVDPDTIRILDANPAALDVLSLEGGDARSALEGRSLLGEIGPDQREAFREHVAAVVHRAESVPVRVTLGPDRVPALARASASRRDAEDAVFVRFALLEEARGRRSAPLEELTPAVEALPDAFLLVAEDGEVLYANAAFAELAEVTVAAVRGRRIQEWLDRPGADWTVVRETLDEHGVVRSFPSAVVGDRGGRAEVELSAAAVEEDRVYAGLVVRHVGRRLGRTTSAGSRWLRSDAPDIGAQVGRTTLAELVDEIVSEVEREFIGVALDMTGGNRTAAAELLGLSRQSLYSRLDRYDLHDR